MRITTQSVRILILFGIGLIIDTFRKFLTKILLVKH